MSVDFSITSFEPKEIIASDYPLVTRHVTIASGQKLERGAVLGKVTASGNYVLSVAEADDGSENPVAILATEEVDASEGAKGAGVYVTGQFNPDALTFGEGHTADSTREALRDLGIHI